MSSETEAPAHPARGVAAALAWLGLLTLAGCSLIYALSATVGDHVEASVSAIGLAWRNGQPLYHAMDAPERYSLLYGPALYGFNRLWYALVPEPLLAGKLAAAFSNSVAMASIYLFSRARLGRRDAVCVVGFAATYLLSYHVTPLGARGDSTLLALVALAIVALPDDKAPARERLLRSICVGVAIGLATGVKAQAAVYFLPAVASLSIQRDPFRNMAVAVASAASFAALPFVLFDHVSLVRYLAWLSQAAGHPRSFSAAFHTALWAVFLLAPLIVTYGLASNRRSAIHSDRALLLGLALATLGVVFFGAKVGAGRHHVVPLIPSVMWLWTRAWGSIERGLSDRSAARYSMLLTAGLVVLLGYGVFRMVASYRWVDDALARSAGRELDHVLERESGRSVAVGYGEPKSLSYLRVVPLAAGHPYLLDSITLMDLSLTGRGVTPATLKLFESCAVESWILPAHSPPFVLSNYYFPDQNVFGSALPSTFEAHYSRVYTLEHLAVWRCKAQAS